MSNSKRPFFDSGLWWVFYSDGSNIECVTSPDGSTWSSPFRISTLQGQVAWNFAIYNTPNNHGIYYAKTIGGPQFYYRYGTTSSGGCNSIGWVMGDTGMTVTNTGGIGPRAPSISVDSNGNIWVILQTSPGFGLPVHVEFWQGSSCTPTCSWVDTQDFNTIRGSSTYQGIIVPLTSGRMTAYYGTFNGGGKAYIQDWSGSSWLSPINMSVGTPASGDPTAYYFEVANSCALKAAGDTTYFEGLLGGTFSNTGFMKHNYGDTFVPSITSIVSGAQTRDAMGCLSWNGTSTIYAFLWTFWNFQNGGPATSIWYRQSTDGGNTFGPQVLITSAANTLAAKGTDIPLMPVNNQLVIVFTDGYSTSICCTVKSVVVTTS